ncbi:1-acylglycerol-3-phosphate O-acyltransferase [Schizosaccharomyces japonicus yFS275]|uniref:1-acyl-sn-glycerol-3-phosphate acyltransferase n=1 Tax=Schizosaccharomyces japonicus (strain yFS275 / FY16936) TaxID=402676 RepID=B6JZC8_SCHJY|nr:1-acylglycerol-3-phosphate O-acyltransferase [Schizosaccharomyces japonicus yFS275]EEB06896.1 1-acylglycerol-3-phosphate O-acyltransferase [Schizosaccharomyces japonicus yFS275]
MVGWKKLILAGIAAVAGVISLDKYRLVPRQFLSYRIRTFVSTGTLLVAAAYGTVMSAICRCFGRAIMGQYLTSRMYYWLGGTILGIKIRVLNHDILKKRARAVLIVNHQSELDIMVIGRTFTPYCSVIAKNSLRYVPFLGWFMILADVVFINRAKRGEAIKIFANAAERMKREEIKTWVFAEGTRSYATEPKILPLKKGAFHLALQADAPIIPIAVQNYSHIFHPPTKHIQPGTFTIKVLNPISTKGKTTADIPELMAQTTKAMNDALVELDSYGKNVKKDN